MQNEPTGTDGESKKIKKPFVILGGYKRKWLCLTSIACPKFNT